MPIVKKQSMKKKAAKSSMASAWDYTDSISLLLYGRSGTGKTTLWATFPSLYWLSFAVVVSDPVS